MELVNYKLTDICNPKQWKNLPTSELTEEGYLVYGANGVIGRYKEYNHLYSALAITCRGATCGTINITEPKSYITANAMVLDDVKDFIEPKFLYYVLVNRGFKDVISGSAQPQITRASLSKIVISIPKSKADQIFIAEILSKTEALITERKESILLLDEYLKSTFLEMFGDPGLNNKKWNIEKLGMTFERKPQIGSITPAIDQGDIPIVRVGEIGNREINFAKCKYCNIIGEDTLSKYLLGDGDILLARAIGSESHLGKASIFYDKGEKVAYDSHVMRLRFNKAKVNPEYFYTFLQTKGGRKRFMSKAGQTAVQFNINSTQISDIDIPVPPVDLQNLFGGVVMKIESLKKEYNESLMELENLYGSLSQRAFKGELKLSNAKVEMNA